MSTETVTYPRTLIAVDSWYSELEEWLPLAPGEVIVNVRTLPPEQQDPYNKRYESDVEVTIDLRANVARSSKLEA